MAKADWLKNEYDNLRGEVNQRLKLLHQFILVAVLLNVVFLLMTFALYLGGIRPEIIILFLLFVPFIFALLTFNYQANQMTMEGAAGYVGHELKDQIPEEDKEKFDGWDVFYDKHKRKYQLISFLKVMALVLPMTLPIIIDIFYRNYVNFPADILMYFDMALFAFVIFSFRYKLGM